MSPVFFAPLGQYHTARVIQSYVNMEDAKTKYTKALFPFSDGSLHQFKDTDPGIDSTSIMSLIESNAIRGQVQKTSSHTTFRDMQITPHGIELLSKWKSDADSIKIQRRLSGICVFIAIAVAGLLVSDLYARWISPYINPKIPDQQVIDLQTPSQSKNK